MTVNALRSLGQSANESVFALRVFVTVFLVSHLYYLLCDNSRFLCGCIPKTNCYSVATFLLH